MATIGARHAKQIRELKKKHKEVKNGKRGHIKRCNACGGGGRRSGISLLGTVRMGKCLKCDGTGELPA
jgi:DnaJ-class molecular chaperone